MIYKDNFINPCLQGCFDEKTPPNWSAQNPVVKARVKRYSTKKVSKHHIEEYYTLKMVTLTKMCL